MRYIIRFPMNYIVACDDGPVFRPDRSVHVSQGSRRVWWWGEKETERVRVGENEETLPKDAVLVLLRDKLQSWLYIKIHDYINTHTYIYTYTYELEENSGR